MWSSVQLQQAQSSESAAAVALQTSSSIGIKRRYEEAMAMAGQNDKMESAITAFEELLERISEEEEDAEEISEECRRIYYLSLSNLARLEASRSSSPTSPINLRVPFLRLLETAEEFEGRPEAAEILLRATRLGIRLNDAWTSSWTLRLYSSLSEKKRSSLDCAVHSLQREIAATPLPEVRLPDLSWPLPSQPRTRRTVQLLPQEERTLSGVAVRGKGRSGEKITIERRITRLKSRGLESAVQENLTLTSSSSPVIDLPTICTQ